MAIAGDFKTKKRGFSLGFGLVVQLAEELPRKYNEKKMGSPDAKGMPVTGKVIRVLGGLATSTLPAVGDTVNVLIRPDDNRKVIFDDMEKTREPSRFLLERVTGDLDALEAGWVHGAGDNRCIEALEIVGAPGITFDNPYTDDPKTLRLHLDGSATTFSTRAGDGTWVDREMPYEEVAKRLKVSVDENRYFKVSQRVLSPSYSRQVASQAELEAVLTEFRQDGQTSCIVRTFVPGTTDPGKVDVQLMDWPEDFEGDGTSPAKTFDMPVLKETKRYAALRDGDEVAIMEVIPGYMLSLVGNQSDTTKSAKHNFVADVVGKGHSDAQKGMYSAQLYGPGFSIRARNEEGTVLGLTRLCSRTEGPQYRNIATIPTPAFIDADKLDYTVKTVPPVNTVPVDSVEEAVPA